MSGNIFAEITDGLRAFLDNIDIDLSEFKAEAVDLEQVWIEWKARNKGTVEAARKAGVQVALCVAMLGTNITKWPPEYAALAKGVAKNKKTLRGSGVLTLSRVSTLFVASVLYLIKAQPSKVKSQILNEGNEDVSKWIRFPQSCSVSSATGSRLALHTMYCLLRSYKQAVTTLSAATFTSKSTYNVLVNGANNKKLYPDDVREMFEVSEKDYNGMAAEIKKFKLDNSVTWQRITEEVPEEVTQMVNIYIN